MSIEIMTTRDIGDLIMDTRSIGVFDSGLGGISVLRDIVELMPCENYIYFGQNKMITRLNILTGDMDFFTNKTCEEMAALAGVW